MNFSSILLFLSFLINCRSENILPDFVVDFNINNETILLEAYHSERNIKIIQGGRKDIYQLLKWYSIGHPVLVESQFNKTKKLFHFTPTGFHASVQMLTKEHKKLLAQKAQEKYNYSAKFYQIEEMKLNEFKCQLNLFGYSN